MSHTSFNHFFPDIAGEETRVITIFKNSDTGLPPGQYAFIDLYCADPDCDCRNVFIQVLDLRSHQPHANISYGWEPIAFYKKWMGGGEKDDDKFILENFKGPALVPFSIQSQYANRWLEFFKEVLRTDKDYAERLERHYRLVKHAIATGK
jgi:hypothetical protein